MSLYLRRLVSGHKTRFRDDGLDIELDLAYVTDKIVVMGFPAVGVESIYRNHRADVQRFLSTRHGSDFWVFNFCPVRENAYPETVFGGRVSRYPFPDHHVPPLLYLSLVAREIHAWLSRSDSRVAVLHCKAGKGRSGTLACAYLLSRYAPSSASVPRSLHESFSQWSLIGDKEGLQTPIDASPPLPATIDQNPVSVTAGPDLSRISSEPTVNTLEQVLDLHTARRMKPSLHPSRRQPDVPLAKKPKMGVSIPSQQRWLFYWSQVLVGKGPPSLRPPTGDPQIHDKMPQPIKVRLTRLTVRMREPSRIQPHLVQAASVVITRAGKRRAAVDQTSGLWASLSRYSDQLVDELQRWEDQSHRPAGTIQTTPFKDDRWDKPKMIHSFARMALSDTQSTDEDCNGKSVVTYVLRHMSEADGEWIRVSGPESDLKGSQEGASGSSAPTSLPVAEDDSEDLSGVLLDADRELRIKLFVGEVPLGWLWIIPAFHMSPDSPTSTVLFSNDEVDFAIGIGKALVDIKISLVRHTCDQYS